MKFDDLTKQLLKRLGKTYLSEFDRNFQNKAFFNSPWPVSTFKNYKGSMMARNNHLRNSLRSEVSGNMLKFTSSKVYAELHNSGGTIAVTMGMKRYFWFKHKEALGKVTTKKNGKTSNSKRNIRYSTEADQWKALALMKIGSVITIPKRQMVGWDDSLVEPTGKLVRETFDSYLKQLCEELNKYNGTR